MVENTFSAHSVRAASTSKANANLVPVDNILKVAGWSNAETFARFYKKPIETAKSGYQKAVLKLWFIIFYYLHVHIHKLFVLSEEVLCYFSFYVYVYLVLCALKSHGIPEGMMT